MIAVERQEIYLRRLAKALDGLRVVHLSDFHYGPLVDPRHLERAIEIANDLKPDLIALTGDYISQERGYAAPCAALVGQLRARHGVYAVLGNHDHWTDASL
ncbi:MAG TPA: metallophosphoesterase, partial [Pyrinomonadaceae bacterium]|nr:metallophosphoesterase [Pyrinomonadaceae bacterium]